MVAAGSAQPRNGGIRYATNKWNAQLQCTWSNEEQWQYERLMFDFSGGYRFNATYELTVSSRNIPEPTAGYANEPGLLRVINRLWRRLDPHRLQLSSSTFRFFSGRTAHPV